MPAINEMSEGFHTQGVAAYIDALKAIVLTQAAEAVKDISEIQTACEANWEGVARDTFLQNVKFDAQHVADEYQNLFNVLTTEIENTSAAMQRFDHSLIQ